MLRWTHCESQLPSTNLVFAFHKIGYKIASGEVLSAVHRKGVRSMPKVAVVLASALLFSSALHAQKSQKVPQETASGPWQRLEMDAKGGLGNSVPSVPHPLEFYLTASPDRDPSNSLCLGCKTANGQAVSLNDFTIKASKELVGETFGRAIYQIELSFEVKKGSVVEQMRHEWEENAKKEGRDVSFQDLPPVKWKSIVMQSSADTYKELYLLIDEGTYVEPLSEARVITVGDARVLATNDPVSGNGGYCTEGYWVLEPEGPWLLNFAAVDEEIAKLIPPDATAVQTGCWALSMENAEVRTPIQLKNARCHACDYLGWVTVRFRLDGHRAVPLSSSFEQGQ